MENMFDNRFESRNANDTRHIYKISTAHIQALSTQRDFPQENSVSPVLIYSDALFLSISIHQGLNGITALIDANWQYKPSTAQ